MHISVKGEYALQAIIDLASQPAGEPVRIADIANRQQIPQKFLELILAGLKQAGFVESRRGAEGGKATIFDKIEGRNPAYSVKCRIGAAMVWDAEKRGILGPGKELVEPTSGNTGIALAFVAAARGYPIHLTMPETMSIERRKVLKALGANLVLTDGAEGMAGSITKAEEMVAADPRRFVMLQQFKNQA